MCLIIVRECGEDQWTAELQEETLRRRNYSEEGGVEEGNLKSADCLELTTQQKLGRSKPACYIIHVISLHRPSEDNKYTHMFVFQTSVTV